MTQQTTYQDTVRRLTEWELTHLRDDADANEGEMLAVLEELADLANSATVRRGEARMDPTAVAKEAQRLFQRGCDVLRAMVNTADQVERLGDEIRGRGAA